MKWLIVFAFLIFNTEEYGPITFNTAQIVSIKDNGDHVIFSIQSGMSFEKVKINETMEQVNQKLNGI